jgi:hypothetical protein
MTHGRLEKPMLTYPGKPTFPFFTDVAVSVPYLRKPDTGLCPEVQESVSHLYNLFSACRKVAVFHF